MPDDKQTVYQQLLVIRAQRGDLRAMEELVGLWEARLFYYVRRLVDQEADAWDVLQKTWIKVFRRIKTLRGPQSLPRWLYTLARNTSIDHARTRLGAPLSLSEPEGCEDAWSEPDEGTALDDAEAVHEALGQLSALHREVLTLFFLEDLSIEEIAEVIGVPQGTVKSRLYYARRALRETMEKEGKR